MNGDFEAIAFALSTILLPGACIFLFLLYRKAKLDAKILSDQLNAALDNINKKNEFFSNMTHELKTPLSVILGAVQLMETKAELIAKYPDEPDPNGNGGTENRPGIAGQNASENSFCKNMAIIKSNCYRLVRLINNLLDISRMEAGYLVLKPVNCDLNLLLDEIVSSVKPYAENKHLDLRYFKSSEPIHTALDMEKFERIMLNLLSNAIKFTNPGGTVCVSSFKSCDRALISVKDTGIGIPREHWQEIFNRFNQGVRCTSSGYEGSGIGLSLVNSFVNLHNGSIKISSEPGKGTEFIIELPIRQINNEEAEFMADKANAGIADAARIEFSHLHTAAGPQPLSERH